MKADEPMRCRFCGERAEKHHVVYRSLGGTDDKRNLVPLCRWHHRDVHDKKLDLLPLLDPDAPPTGPYVEQGHAASLIGIERAHRLLAPSVYRHPTQRDFERARELAEEHGWP